MKHSFISPVVMTGLVCAFHSAHAGMAPEKMAGFESYDVTGVMNSVIKSTGRAKSAPAYPISDSGPNRIAVTGKKITNAIYDATQLDVQTDAVTGQVFVFPRTQENVALFLTTDDRETYALPLVPKQIASQEIGLGKTAPKKVRESYTQKVFTESIESASDFDTKVTRLIRALARNELPEGFHATNRCGKNCLKSMTSDTLEGKVLTHKNTSKNFVTLEEKLFYTEGVLAVAIPRTNLAPSESTRVYVVSKPAYSPFED